MCLYSIKIFLYSTKRTNILKSLLLLWGEEILSFYWRIHRWSIQNEGKISYTGAASAHDGRVNALVVCQALNALISVGNDGCINVRMIDNYDNDISKWEEVTSLNLGNQHDGDEEVNDQNNIGNGKSMLQQRKITSLCIVHEEPTSAMIAVGTSCGQISLANIIKSKDKIIHASVLDDKAIVEMENGEGTVVHSLCSKRYGDRCRIVAGHSAGLCVMDLETAT